MHVISKNEIIWMKKLTWSFPWYKLETLKQQFSINKKESVDFPISLYPDPIKSKNYRKLECEYNNRCFQILFNSQ